MAPKASAFLGFPDGGPSVHFRLDPDQIEWNFNIHTRVFHTIGGRVIQVLGGSLSDLVITGSIGESFSAKGQNDEWQGESWRLHELFVDQVREMMKYQSRDASIHRSYSSKMHTPARFSYPPKGWNFTVYVKDISDPKGGSITHAVGRPNHQYKLTLFIVEDASSSITRVKSKAINDYIDRISNGIGWKYSEFNGEGWENLDPYGDQWGEAVDLSEIEGRDEENSETEETDGGGSTSGGGSSAPVAGTTSGGSSSNNRTPTRISAPDRQPVPDSFSGSRSPDLRPDPDATPGPERDPVTYIPPSHNPGATPH